MNDWINASVKCPETGETVLIVVEGLPWIGFYQNPIGELDISGQWWRLCSDIDGQPENVKVDWWMHFPDIPRE